MGRPSIRGHAETMVKADVQGVPNYGGIDFEASPSRKPLRKAIAFLTVTAVLVVAVATISLNMAEAQEGSVLQSLAGSGSSKKQPVKYGDTITLMNVYNNYMVVSANGRTFTGRYIAKVTCRAAVITSASQFTTVGGSGPIMVGDKVAFKSIYGFVTGTPGGVRADTPTVTSAEEYTVGIPGQEVGLAARPGLSYGMTVTLQNR